MKELMVHGRRIAYEACPAQPQESALATVFIHGTGGDAMDWEGQLGQLSDICAAIAIDLPGHGQSDGPGEPSVGGYAKWVADFIEALNLRQVVVVGCSLGSAVTLDLAIQNRPWLKGVGLVGSGSRLKVHPDFLQGVLVNKELAVSALRDFALSAGAADALRDIVAEKFMRNPAEIINWDLGACNSFDVGERLGEIKVPTLIVTGEEDRLTPVKYAHFLNKGIAGSRLNVIPNAGHLVMMERAEEFNGALRAFLSEIKD